MKSMWSRLSGHLFAQVDPQYRHVFNLQCARLTQLRMLIISLLVAIVRAIEVLFAPGYRQDDLMTTALPQIAVLLLLAGVCFAAYRGKIIRTAVQRILIYGLGLVFLVLQWVYVFTSGQIIDSAICYLLVLVPILSRPMAALYTVFSYAMTLIAMQNVTIPDIILWYNYPQTAAILAIVSLFISFLSYNAQVTSFTLAEQISDTNTRLKEANEKLGYLNAALEKQSTTDQLTGIFNRRAFDDYLDTTWNQSQRGQTSLSILLIDIDHFKSYNDYLGHLEGDGCLKLVAKCIQGCFKRSVDLTARYGGEEFAVIMPFATETSALASAERVRLAIENAQIAHPASPVGPYVTVSVGAATCIPAQGERSDRLIGLADNAMYEAKRTGRNRAVSSTCQEES